MREARIDPEELIEAERLLRKNYQFDLAQETHQRIRQIYAILGKQIQCQPQKKPAERPPRRSPVAP